MVEQSDDRKLTREGTDFISCNMPCNKDEAIQIEGKFKPIPGSTTTFRCVASGAALRGQNFGLKEGHKENPAACRVCLVYTSIPPKNVDNSNVQA